MDGEGMEVSCAHFISRAARDMDWCFEKGIKQQSMINIIMWMGTEFELEWQKSKGKELMLLFWN